MAATSPSLSDRITAATITVLVHALIVVVMVMGLQSDGGPGSRSVPDTAPGEHAWTAIHFVTEQKQAAAETPPAALETRPQPAPVEESPIPEPAPDGESATADATPSADAASSEAAALSPAEAAASFDAGEAGGADAPQDDLGARYLAAVRTAVLEQWDAMGGGAIPAGCEVVIEQVDGGQAIRAWTRQCGDLPMSGRIRLETAAMQAQPLPYEGFEPVFQAHLKLTF